jgi:hypothetical protein
MISGRCADCPELSFYGLFSGIQLEYLLQTHAQFFDRFAQCRIPPPDILGRGVRVGMPHQLLEHPHEIRHSAGAEISSRALLRKPSYRHHSSEKGAKNFVRLEHVQNHQDPCPDAQVQKRTWPTPKHDAPCRRWCAPPKRISEAGATRKERPRFDDTGPTSRYCSSQVRQRPPLA